MHGISTSQGAPRGVGLVVNPEARRFLDIGRFGKARKGFPRCRAGKQSETSAVGCCCSCCAVHDVCGSGVAARACASAPPILHRHGPVQLLWFQVFVLGASKANWTAVACVRLVGATRGQKRRVSSGAAARDMLHDVLISAPGLVLLQRGFQCFTSVATVALELVEMVAS